MFPRFSFSSDIMGSLASGNFLHVLINNAYRLPHSWLLPWPTFQMSLINTSCRYLLADFGAQNLRCFEPGFANECWQTPVPYRVSRAKVKLKCLRETCMAGALHDPWTSNVPLLGYSYMLIHKWSWRETSTDSVFTQHSFWILLYIILFNTQSSSMMQSF